MKKKDVRLKGQLKMYMRWPLIMTVLLIAMNFWMYRIDRQAAGMMSVFVIIYAAVVGILYFHNRSLILADMIQFSTQDTEYPSAGAGHSLRHSDGGRPDRVEERPV